MAILITKDGRIISKAEESEFKNEAYLQRYISENPELIPLEEIHSEKRRFIATLREFNTYSGPIDILAIDDRGDIYIIETKLSRNADKRKVIAQILDYAAAIWEEYSNNPKSFIEKVETIPDFEVAEDVVENISRNLSEGNFKLIVAMDSLDRRLKTLIRFLKSHSTFDIYALEFDHYQFRDVTGNSYEIFVPKLFGVETTEKKAVSTSSSGRRKWTVEEFLDYVRTQLPPERAEAILKVYNKAKELGWTITAGTSKWGSINLIPPGDMSEGRSLITLYAGNGVLQVNFGWLPNTQLANYISEILAERLNSIGIELPRDYRRKYPNIREQYWIPNIMYILDVLGEIDSILKQNPQQNSL